MYPARSIPGSTRGFAEVFVDTRCDERVGEGDNCVRRNGDVDVKALDCECVAYWKAGDRLPGTIVRRYLTVLSIIVNSEVC